MSYVQLFHLCNILQLYAESRINIKRLLILWIFYARQILRDSGLVSTRVLSREESSHQKFYVFAVTTFFSRFIEQHNNCHISRTASKSLFRAIFFEGISSLRHLLNKGQLRRTLNCHRLTDMRDYSTQYLEENICRQPQED